MDKPLYQKIIDDVIHDINNGVLEPGMKIPSQRSLAAHYHVNRTTVVHAIEQLKSEGILETKEKQGIYVADNNWSKYIHNNLNWQNYIGNSSSANNQFYIREINRCEFQKDIIRLSTGELSPSLIPNDQFREIIQNDWDIQLSSNYEEPKGNILLRKQIKALAEKRGINCEVEEICITSGALQGLKLIADGLLIPKSKIIVETPSYINSIRTWHNIHSKIVPLSIDYIKTNINSIFRENEDYTGSLFYCNPTLHNPTTHTYSIEEKYKILDQCKRKGIPIVEDDIYSELWFDGQIPKSMKELDDTNQVLYLGSLSKTVSPGLRIGWLIGNERVIDHLADLKMQNDYGASSISQFIATKWLENYHEEHIEKIKEKLKRSKQIMEQALTKYLADLGWWKPVEGSFYIWFRFNKRIDLKKLFQMALGEHILIHPGEIYSDKANDSLRFSYSYIDENDIESSINKLRMIIDRNKLV
ncbi:GntR family transcriptional regulator [Macrococcus hajekii]|uniref:aminotransferase-like domain-containing protein n=1 Tax=Macrococcus hajekii TaxID=198482 RepID=UPI001407E0EF|nr:PLP-dependent aminotransferase family protein [Macrococcus hajekii]GGB03504.1 GntR family transcriptional regulator [Macrococcus hajekii]